MKRVGCLYRVSTKKQVYKNDIPVQRKACRKFITGKKDWKLEKEYVELGISGYKLSSTERDVLQQIKKDVLDKKIDILLVFMFDRIGRKEDETPFVVEWLVEHKIEVWSVNEGQRDIKDRYDKLINYITYWQAEGESEKISQRATERRIQLTRDGVYLGNYPPYGYKMIESEELTSIGKKRRILEIYPQEEKIILTIFSLVIDTNMGTDKIAIYLNKKKIKRRKSTIKWDNDMILTIIRNPIYKGYVSFGKRNKQGKANFRNKKEKWIIADKPNPNIIIIPEERWEKANQIIDSRSRPGERVIRLLSGLTRCGYCNEHIVPKGKNKYIYMLCKGKQKTGFCEYIANYRIDRLEKIVREEIKKYLDTFQKVDLRRVITNQKSKVDRRKEKIAKIEKRIKIKNDKLKHLKNSVIDAIMSGDEHLKKELNEKIKIEYEDIEISKNRKEELEKELENIDAEIEYLKTYIPNWSEEFEKAPLEIQRQILNILVNKVILYNNKIEIDIKYPISNMIIVKKEKENDQKKSRVLI